MNDRLLTVREVAELLSVCRATVLSWIAKGQLPGYRLPSGAMRVSQAELRPWLEERRT